MNIIVPMAGAGKRMRPHTLTIPKPLIPVAGKPIVEHLVRDLANMCDEKINEIAFVTGHFGEDAEKMLLEIAASLGAKGSIHYQDEALGTAHAVYCAEKCLTGKTIIAFADTIFRADFKLDENKDGVIWVKQVEDPRQFGVVKLNANNEITDFIEKPQKFVSNLAIIGIYYFKDGDNLKKEIEYLLHNNIKEKGEYQLTNALENMKSKGLIFAPGTVNDWLDCGNKDNTVASNSRVLELEKYKYSKIPSSVKLTNSIIIPPCFIGENVALTNSIVGPYVSLGNNSKVNNSQISNSIVRENTEISNANLNNSMLGSHTKYTGKSDEISISDYSVIG